MSGTNEILQQENAVSSSNVTIATPLDAKQELTKIIMGSLYEKKFKSSEEFLQHLKEKHPDSELLNSVKVNNIDDKYGIFTFTVENKPPASNVEFRLKTENAYGGPKVEHYLDRVNLKIDAAIALAKENPALQAKIPELETTRQYVTQQIEKDCNLDHHLLGDLNKKSPNVRKEFDTKHEKALEHCAVLMALLTQTLQQEGKAPSDIKNQLYNKERSIMSKRRPERITVRKLSDNYIEVNTTIPVKADRTVSSAKKDEVGVANWVKSKNEIYVKEADKLRQVHQSEGYRSASIIPHELIDKGEFSRQIAIEVTRRNVVEDILPQIAQELIRQGKGGNPLVINYEMLTLLSPIHKAVDRKDTNNPDATQFSAIRAALNQYDGRTINITLPNGESKDITLDAIYHNYGANMGRGFKIEKATNLKAFNKIIDRSMITLLNRPESPFHDFFNGMPKFTAGEKLKIEAKNERLNEIYRQIESKELPLKDHNLLVELNTKKIESGLSDHEQRRFDELSDKFNKFREDKRPLMREARLLEGDIRHLNVDLSKRRMEYCFKHYDAIKLSSLENNPNNNPSTKEAVEHMRTLTEYVRLVSAGYDSKFMIAFTQATKTKIEQANIKNYEIQSYIQNLSNYNNVTFHKTCKSGKDRTNTAEEKAKAKAFLGVLNNRVPKFNDDPEVKRKEAILYEQGFLKGPGNDLCGDNMKPGLQQVSALDIATHSVDIEPILKGASLQKGIDLLKAKPEAVASAESTIKELLASSKAEQILNVQPASVQPQASNSNNQQALFEVNSPALTAVQKPEPTAIIHIPQLSGKVLNKQLTSLEKMQKLSHFGIKDFQLENPAMVGTGPHHFKINMYSTQDKSASGKTTEVHATSTPDAKGITYSIDKELPQDEQSQTIKQLCLLAVATAKPGAEFKIATQDPVKAALTRKALEAALKAKYPHTYVEGQLKVPTISNCLQHANQFSQESNLTGLEHVARMALVSENIGAHGNQDWKLQKDEFQVMNLLIKKALTADPSTPGHKELKELQQRIDVFAKQYGNKEQDLCALNLTHDVRPSSLSMYKKSVEAESAQRHKPPEPKEVNNEVMKEDRKEVARSAHK